MPSEERIKNGFNAVKEDIEGVKDELAFALNRIAKLESLLLNREIKELSKQRQK